MGTSDLEPTDTDDAGITISGKVTGQVTVGDHNIVISAAHGSMVTLLNPGELPRPVRRDPIALLPRRGMAPVGRASELDRLVGMAKSGGQVQVYGEPGIGKTTVLRWVAHRLANRGDPVVFLNGGGRDTDDLLQDIFESCFDSTGYRPSSIELRRLMSGLQVSLVIDDLETPEELLEAVPDACLVWSSARRASLIDGRSEQLTGLAQTDGIVLVERHLNKPLDASETAMAEALWAFANGRPSSIIQALAATNGNASLPTAENDLLTALLPQLDPVARHTLGLLHSVAPAAITSELLHAILPPSGSVDQLVRCGLVAADEDGLRISLGAAMDLPTELRAGPNQVADAIRSLLVWLATPTTTTTELGVNGPAIARLIELAINGGHADLACQLARAAAPAVGTSLRWGSWRMILAHGSAAARKIRDSHALAYFTHEDGIRSLGLGKRVVAGAALGTAVALWQHLGDSTGTSASHGAQALTNPSPTPGAPTPHLPAPSPAPPPPPPPGTAPPPPESATTPPHNVPPPAITPHHGTPFPAPGSTPSPWRIPGSEHVAATAAAKAGMPLIIKLFIIVVAIAVGGLGAYAVTNALSTDDSNQSGEEPGTPGGSPESPPAFTFKDQFEYSHDGYRYQTSFEVAVSKPWKDIQNAAPGKAIFIFGVTGKITITNLLSDRTAPSSPRPDTIYAWWPVSSPICQLGLFEPASMSSAGDELNHSYCGGDIADSTSLDVSSLDPGASSTFDVRAGFSPGGTGEGFQTWIKEDDYDAFAEAFESGPASWGWTSYGGGGSCSVRLTSLLWVHDSTVVDKDACDVR